MQPRSHTRSCRSFEFSPILWRPVPIIAAGPDQSNWTSLRPWYNHTSWGRGDAFQYFGVLLEGDLYHLYPTGPLCRKVWPALRLFKALWIVIMEPLAANGTSIHASAFLIVQCLFRINANDDDYFLNLVFCKNCQLYKYSEPRRWFQSQSIALCMLLLMSGYLYSPFVRAGRKRLMAVIIMLLLFFLTCLSFQYCDGCARLMGFLFVVISPLCVPIYLCVTLLF